MTNVDLVDFLIAAGEPLAEIERRLIDTSPLDSESRDALWLYAWAASERSTR